MDAQGRFWFEGDALEHPRVVRYFRRHLEATDTLEPIICVDGKFVHLRCEDAPFRVTGVDVSGGEATLSLDDGRDVPMDPGAVYEEGLEGLWTLVPTRQSGHLLPARFTNPAAVGLAEHIDEDEPPGFRLGARRFTIQRAPLPRPAAHR